MVCMPISERQVASLHMAIGWQVTPKVAKLHAHWGNTEMRIKDAVLVVIEKDKDLAGWR